MIVQRLGVDGLLALDGDLSKNYSWIADVFNENRSVTRFSAASVQTKFKTRP
jgi:hypothetical protein